MDVGPVAAFVAGLVSFLSPCVLPLLPVYIAFMTGMSLSELTAADRSFARLLGPVMFFVVGFTLVFVGLGASASVLGSFFQANRTLLDALIGAMLVLLGIVLLDVLPLPWLHGATVDASRFRRYGPLAAFALGLAFPIAMGPCAGPVYGPILMLAATRETAGQGAFLLLVYSLGIAVPFIAASILLSRVTPLLRWLTRHTKTINRFAGALLVAIGLLLLTGRLAPLMAWLSRYVPSIEL